MNTVLKLNSRKEIMTVSAGWSVTTELGGYGPTAYTVLKVELGDDPTNIAFAKALINMGVSILEKSSPPKLAMPEEPTTIMAGLACGHASYVSIYPDKDGKPQCIDCANKMRGIA